MVCTKCSQTLSALDRFCSRCGTACEQAKNPKISGARPKRKKSELQAWLDDSRHQIALITLGVAGVFVISSFIYSASGDSNSNSVASAQSESLQKAPASPSVAAEEPTFDELRLKSHLLHEKKDWATAMLADFSKGELFYGENKAALPIYDSQRHGFALDQLVPRSLERCDVVVQGAKAVIPFVAITEQDANQVSAAARKNHGVTVEYLIRPFRAEISDRNHALIEACLKRLTQLNAEANVYQVSQGLATWDELASSQKDTCIEQVKGEQRKLVQCEVVDVRITAPGRGVLVSDGRVGKQ